MSHCARRGRPELTLKTRVGWAEVELLSHELSIGPPSIRRNGHGQLLRPADSKLLHFHANLPDRLRGVEQQDHGLLPRSVGDPPTASGSPAMIEDIINGMISLFRGHLHRGDVSNRDFAVEGC